MNYIKYNFSTLTCFSISSLSSIIKWHTGILQNFHHNFKSFIYIISSQNAVLKFEISSNIFIKSVVKLDYLISSWTLFYSFNFSIWFLTIAVTFPAVGMKNLSMSNTVTSSPWLVPNWNNKVDKETVKLLTQVAENNCHLIKLSRSRFCPLI